MCLTVCQVGDRIAPVASYTSKNTSYSSHSKQRRGCIDPSQIVCKYRNHKKYMVDAGVEPKLQGEVHLSAGRRSIRCHIHDFVVFFSWVNLNFERLPMSRMLGSDIGGSKRRIKMDI